VSARKRCLDLYCCEGGAAHGYADAGFEVVGVDIIEQPRYPFEFHQADAVAYARGNAEWIRESFDFVHASPPCQFDSECQRIMGREHPNLIGPTREALEDLGLPYVIENVDGARSKLKNPVTLCGGMFGIETYRHRLFEAGNGITLSAPEHPAHVARQAKMGRAAKPSEYMHIVGNFSGVARGRQIMGMPWATRRGLAEAIPPVYTECIGHQVMAQLGAA
jgi:DNA (cytosine-5)-methyltransferase 1